MGAISQNLHHDESQMNKFKRPFSIALLSAAIIAFQLALIQILSISQWYHFAYMVISIALLGFGAAGSLLALFQKYLDCSACGGGRLAEVVARF